MTSTVKLFAPGRFLMTPGARDQVPQVELFAAIERHLAGDWGTVCEEDWQANDQALQDVTRLLSSYVTDAGVRFWIITEADRSATTVLLPDEY